MRFVLELRVSLEAASLSLGIEARFVYISPSPDPISSFAICGIYWVWLLLLLLLDGVPKVEKSRLEQATLNEMCEVLGGGKREIKELWREYEDNASLEANLVKDFDKIEMILQALEYETGTFRSRSYYCLQ
ncbi:putative HD domain-containing protein [Helianthus anomalus]